jgi:hypothetical protein
MATTPRKGRPTRRTASVNQHIPDTERGEQGRTGFDPDEALGTLWYQVARVEALAQAACQALEFLPSGPDQESRRAAERLHVLVAATAEASTAALDAVDEQMSRLISSLETEPESDTSESSS